MKDASEMTRAEILRDAFGVRRDKMQAAGTSDRVSAIAIGAQAECTRLEIRIHQLKNHQAQTDKVLRYVVEDETCGTTGVKVGVDGCECVWCDAKRLLGGRTA